MGVWGVIVDLGGSRYLVQGEIKFTNAEDLTIKYSYHRSIQKNIPIIIYIIFHLIFQNKSAKAMETFEGLSCQLNRRYKNYIITMRQFKKDPINHKTAYPFFRLNQIFSKYYLYRENKISRVD